MMFSIHGEPVSVAGEDLKGVGFTGLEDLAEPVRVHAPVGQCRCSRASQALSSSKALEPEGTRCRSGGWIPAPGVRLLLPRKQMEEFVLVLAYLLNESVGYGVFVRGTRARAPRCRRRVS